MLFLSSFNELDLIRVNHSVVLGLDLEIVRNQVNGSVNWSRVEGFSGGIIKWFLSLVSSTLVAVVVLLIVLLIFVSVYTVGFHTYDPLLLRIKYKDTYMSINTDPLN